tara:strand:+ start:161 stop:868 length:708 start_codon:yes stop_codon:yes gene_type:complete
VIQEQENKTMVFAFGRYNPPTIGHQKLIEKVAEIAQQQGAPYNIFVSQTQNRKKNPLEYKEKVMFMKKIFPKHNSNIVYNTEYRTIFHILEGLEKAGIENIIMVAGEDRVQEFDKLLKQYDGQEYNFQNIQVVSAGQRDPDSEGAEGASSTKMRASAAAGDFLSFREGLPLNTDENVAERIYQSVRGGMGIQESFHDMILAMVEEEVNEMSTMAGGAVEMGPRKPKKRNKKLKTN